MFPDTAISTFISALNNRIPPPVHTAGIENDRPVPAVILDGVSIEEHNHHNNHKAGYRYDENGNISSEVRRHYYTLQIELNIRDDDEVSAYGILSDVLSTMDEIDEDPQSILHEDVNTVRSLGSGGVSYQFYEPTETEINQTVQIETFYDSERPVDLLESINKSYNIS